MLTYRPRYATADPDSGEVYAHPSRALVEAQRLAAEQNGASEVEAVALFLEHVSDDEFAAVCPSCFAPVGALHLRTCDRARDGVLEHEAVIRPAEQAIREQS